MEKNSLYYIKILTLLLAGCLFIAGCENDVNEVRDLSRKKPSIEEGKNIDYYLSMNGKMNARLTAPLLVRYQGDSAKKSEFPQSLHVDFFNDSMKIESQLSAQYGRYLEDDNKVFLRDKVIAFNIKGDSLFTDELYWDRITGRFFTDKKVIVSLGFRSTRYVALDGMNCSQDLSDKHFFRIENGSYTTIPDSTASDKPVGPAPAPVIKPK